MVIANCTLNQLIYLESILFSIEWEDDPHISPFSIRCDDELYCYKIKKVFNKYRIVTI